MEDCPAQTLEFVARDGTGLYVQLAQWGRGDGLVVMELHERNASPSSDPSVPQDDVAVSGAPDDNAPRDARVREGFRCALVELMQASVETWERTTGTSRLELAEKSRIWRVNIDDGRLRARAMERYLAVSKLPQNPRWRDVMRSAYFVLTQCTMEPQAQEELQRQVDAVLAYTRRDASV
jgi:two-component system, sensor histidine kinase ChiS